ncbi:hypothetical protein O1611_g6530 [Lasiodiplodia mahajangana]|uniref:Uncharacterized protein n=1 Tax=Lasiodiplodia mahajangana TaxID=1108764 RepID=A0ACC2JI18_9PEZI|nr:hypothetical protein O1611_g6530 [Lasiodiplodia mahajangana]
MAKVDPEERASAAQMLVKLYDGNGLSTPREQVRPLFTRLDAQVALAATEVAAEAEATATVPVAKKGKKARAFRITKAQNPTRQRGLSFTIRNYLTELLSSAPAHAQNPHDKGLR